MVDYLIETPHVNYRKENYRKELQDFLIVRYRFTVEALPFHRRKPQISVTVSP